MIRHHTNSRTHLSLDKDSPQPRPVCPLGDGCITAIAQVGGLHHRYERRAASLPSLANEAGLLERLGVDVSPSAV
jgi:hypothetical protein